MGGLRLARRSVAPLVAALLIAALPRAALGFSGFGPVSAQATYGESMTFGVELRGGAPDKLELLLEFEGDDGLLVAPVSPQGGAAEYVWDAADRHVPPNTLITYSWRASHDGEVTVSQARELLYDDDRPGLDWQTRRLGDATVHWYGDREETALRLGQLAADGTASAEELLGHQLAGPVDIFAYGSVDDFFGALGPGAREWTGAATYPAIRTIFMQLENNTQAYLDTTIVHEVTHVVFNDATDNPFHEPAKWLNEGLASWSERRSADEERSNVEFEASGGGLFAFDAISEQFPIGTRGSFLAYAQGATMVDMIISEHGPGAIARMAEAYRDGASDDEALQAGTGARAEALFDDFYAEFGVERPQPVEPAEILPSNVRKPGQASGQGGDGSPPPAPDESPAEGGPSTASWAAVIGAVVVVLLLAGMVAWRGRRSRARSS